MHSENSMLAVHNLEIIPGEPRYFEGPPICPTARLKRIELEYAIWSA